MKISTNLFSLLALLMVVIFFGCSKPEIVSDGATLAQCKKNAYGCYDVAMKLTGNNPLPDSTENIWVFVPEVDYNIGQGYSPNRMVCTVKDQKELEKFIFQLTKTELDNLPNHLKRVSFGTGHNYTHEKGEFPWYVNEVRHGKYHVINGTRITIDMDRNTVYITD